MRYPASEKLEIIRTVEASHLPTRQTLKMLSIPSSTYYDWYARWSDGGIDALADRSPRPGSVWNRIPDDVREDVVDYPTRDAARQDVFEYIELFYNTKRKHTNNGMLSPVDFEIRQQKLNEAGV
jgi:transposase-like protein